VEVTTVADSIEGVVDKAGLSGSKRTAGSGSDTARVLGLSQSR